MYNFSLLVRRSVFLICHCYEYLKKKKIRASNVQYFDEFAVLSELTQAGWSRPLDDLMLMSFFLFFSFFLKKY